MESSKITKILLFLTIILLCTECTTNHYQQDFRRQALSKPAGIQAMQAGGHHKPGSKSDPADWRTAPDFSGLFEVVTPAYPNPVSYNSTIHISFFVKSFDAINSIKIYAFRQPSHFQLSALVRTIPKTFNHGIHTIKIEPRHFAQPNATGNFGNIYRILLLNGQNRIITYGDIQVK